jgi:hypothetical protein
MKLGNRKHLLVASVAAVVVWGYVLFLSPGGRQARWMAESREVLPRLQSALDSESRFAHVLVGVSTSCQVVVLGLVRSERDLQDLQALLASIDFPHGVYCEVTVE